MSSRTSHHFHNDFLLYRTINHNHRKRIRLTIPYSKSFHIKICTIIIKLQSQIQKLKNISCRRNCLNFIIFSSIRLHRAENPRIKYIHRQTSKIVLKIVIKFQIHTGFHFILLCISQNTQAHITNHMTKFLSLIFELKNKYKIGNAQAHNIADIKIHQFWLEDSIQK